MPEITQPQVLAAIKARIEAVADVGIVLTRERFVESESEFAKLFMALNSQVPQGWLISFVGFTQELGDAQCEIRRIIKYALESLYPYDDKRSDGETSHVKFREMIEAVNRALNVHTAWDLGLGGDVRHRFLQSEADFTVRKWGEGTDARLTHYASFSFEVQVSVYL